MDPFSFTLQPEQQQPALPQWPQMQLPTAPTTPPPAQQNPMAMFAQMMQQLMQPQQQQPQQNGLAQLIQAIQPKHLGMGGAEVTQQNPTGDMRNPFGTGFFKNPAERQGIEQSRQAGMPSVQSLANNPYYLSQGTGSAGAVAASLPSYASPQDVNYWQRKDLWEQTRRPAGKPMLPNLG